MKAISALFEEYKLGKLPEEKINELNTLLIQQFFNASDEMNCEEADYTIDLIAEQFLQGELSKKYIEALSIKIKNEEKFAERFSFLINLDEAVEASKNIHNLNQIEEEDVKEEEQLEQMLREVVEEASVEMEASSFSWSKQFEKATNSLKNTINQITPDFQWFQPEHRLIAIVASVVIIAIVIWFNFEPVIEKQLATVNGNDSLELNIVEDGEYETRSDENKVPGKSRSAQEKPKTEDEYFIDESDRNELNKRKRITDLLAANFEISPRFNYTLTRTVTTSAIDLLILAAKNYNDNKFEECIQVLNELIKDKVFINVDTNSMINFYLGNSFLALGKEKADDKMLKKSLSSFSEIGESTPYYLPSKWYASLAYLKLDNASEALRLLDTLYLANYLRDGKVEIMRDSIEMIINENPSAIQK